MTSSRTVPFTLHESITLCEFISEEKSIERKGTSVELRSDKSEAWTRVQTKFNALGLREPRTITALQNRWKLMKALATKDEGIERREMCQTGGGKAELKKNLPDSLVQAINRVRSLLPVQGNPNAPDSNADFPEYYYVNDSELVDDDLCSNKENINNNNISTINNNDDNSTVLIVQYDDPNMTESHKHHIEVHDNEPLREVHDKPDQEKPFVWKKYKPQDLKRKVSSPLASSSGVKKSKTNNFRQYHNNLDAKEQVLQKQLEHFNMIIANEEKEEARRQKEHELRMKVMTFKAANEEKRAQEIHNLQIAQYK